MRSRRWPRKGPGPGSSRAKTRSRRASAGSRARSNRRVAFTVDQGAAKALASGKSLLPAGVAKVEGSFERGDAVVIRNGDGIEIGRGLTAYDHEEAKAIIGRKSGEIAEILGYFGRAELIHRDDMVMQRKM